MAHTILLGISCHGSFVINYSKFGQVIQNMSYIGFFFHFKLWWLFCSIQRNHLCNFGRGHYGDYSCEII